MSGGGGGSITGNNFLDMGVMIGASMLAPELAPEFLMAEEGGLGLSAAQAAGVTGAALGGGIQAVAGGNPLMGAVTGGIGGYGAGGGFSGLFGGAETANPSGLTTTTGGGITAAAPAAVGPEVAGTVGTQYAPEFMSEAVPNVAPEVGATGDIARSAATGGAPVDVNGLPYSSTPAPTNQVPGVDQTSKGFFGSLSPLQKAAVVGAGGLGAYSLLNQDKKNYGIPASVTTPYTGGNLDKLHYDPSKYTPTIAQPPNPVYQANYTGYARPPGYAGGGLLDPNSEPVDFMGGDMYPQSQQQRSYYATPTQMPTSAQQSAASYEPKTNPLTGEPSAGMAGGGSGIDALKDLMGSRDAIQNYKSQHSQNPKAVLSKAQGGDYNAMLAMNQLRGTPNANYAGGGSVRHFDLGGFIDSVVQTPIFHAETVGNQYQDNPEQAALGINTPGEAYVWNNATGKQYKPTVNMLGGPSETAYAKGQQQGVDMSAGRTADAVAPAVLSYMLSPAAGIGAGVANQYGQAYDRQMSGLQYQNPNLYNGFAQGGIANLGSYSDGGHMLKGPGDGMSDSIPASIQGKQPARLATNEFVVPADVVSHLGNGSSDAGAKKLYNMMDKVRKARTGKSKQAPAIKADKYLPA